MSEAKHSPAPWRFEIDEKRGEVFGYFVKAADGHEIGYWDADDDRPQIEANARLIGSATDMAETIAKQSALLAQMAAALEKCSAVGLCREGSYDARQEAESRTQAALTAYATMSPDPQWQRVPEGCVVVPLEPTWGLDAMSGAGAEAIPAVDGWTGSAGNIACEVYKAMIANYLNRAREEG